MLIFFSQENQGATQEGGTLGSIANQMEQIDQLLEGIKQNQQKIDQLLQEIGELLEVIKQNQQQIDQLLQQIERKQQQSANINDGVNVMLQVSIFSTFDAIVAHLWIPIRGKFFWF